MSQIKVKHTKSENLLRSAIHKPSLRFIVHTCKLSGMPDIISLHDQTEISINGCFWHCHEGYKYAYMPTSTVEFWESKLSRTIQRGMEENKEFMRLSRRVVSASECHINNGFDRLLPQLLAFFTELN